MNTPTEPEGGHLETTITLLNNAGKPWKGGYIDHNWKRYYTDKNGQARLKINGGGVSANEYPVTKLVKDKVYVTLQYDAWKGGIYEKSTD